jgi:3-hydroxy-3-methylglutaryl CoA synthase/uncharacterized OB-fold protein
VSILSDSSSIGIVSYAAYIPYFRLERSTIATALGIAAGKGTRAIASYDEDTTSMGVEAARAALAACPGDAMAEALYFATAMPAYTDKTNATVIHAALELDRRALAVDMTGSVRSGIGAIRAAVDAAGMQRPTLVVLSDVRTGLPGSGDEMQGGDGAAALLFGSGSGVLAEVLAFASATTEFLDRWRRPGARSSEVWEERFGEHVYLPLVKSAVEDAAALAGVAPAAFDHVVITGTHSRAVGRAAGAIGVRPESVAPSLDPVIGNAGTAAVGLALASVLDRAGPNQLVLAVNLADGADALVLRTTEALATARGSGVADRLTGPAVSYTGYLTWRGMMEREPPRRPDPVSPAAPPSYRQEDWKFAFVGSRCTACGTRHLPPQRVCVQCRVVDEMSPEPLADTPATVATFTVDRLAFSPSPPVVLAVIDFDGGGRFQCELTDVDPASVRVGDRVQMTFRRIFTANGVHNYFWKARPLQQEEAMASES